MTINTPRLAVLGAFLFWLLPVPALAQSTVRVTKDQAVIWRPGFTVVADTVKAGTVLDVVARRGDWYEVVLPSPPGTTMTGMIAVGQVEAVSGTPPADSGPVRFQQRPSPASLDDHGLRGFGQIGYGRFTAHQSFKAIFDSSMGFWFGGGADYRWRQGLFVAGSIDVFHRKGERVFVHGQDVFRLGISDSVTLLPIVGTVGYRFRSNGTIPYIGGGAGLSLYRESSQFADPSENVRRSFATYHALGGFEWRNSTQYATALEVQYTHVPQDFSGGVADAFNEHDLGGLQARVKLLFGTH